MRAAKRSEQILGMGGTEEERQLRKAVLHLSNALKCYRTSVWRRCGSAWRKRIFAMQYSRLKREFYFLLTQCGFQRIAVFYKRFCVNNSFLTKLVGEFVKQTGLQDLHVFKEIMESYRFCELCKYNFLKINFVKTKKFIFQYC